MLQRKIRYFKIDQASGARIPYEMVLDHEMTLLQHYKVEYDELNVKDSRMRRRRTDNAQTRKMEVLAKWCVKGFDNPLPGTDDLRAQYWEKFDEVSMQTDEERGCKLPCGLSRLQRAYMERLEELGKFKHLEDDE